MSLCIWSRVVTQLQSRPTCPCCRGGFEGAFARTLHARTINTAAERNHARPSTASPPCGSTSVAETAETRHRFAVDRRHALWVLQWKTNRIIIIRLIMCGTTSNQWTKVKIKSGTCDMVTVSLAQFHLPSHTSETSGPNHLYLSTESVASDRAESLAT